MARIFITGSTDGLGHAAALKLLRQGDEVALHARTRERAEQISDLAKRSIGVVVGDLSNANEVRDIADQVNALGRMDAVIHNAGIYNAPTRGSTPEGHATVFGVNTLAPYILTALIERPTRLVYLSSGLHRGGEGSLADIDWTQRPWDGGKAYAETKLQVVALALALATRWPKVICSAVDPGWVRTRMGGANAPVDLDTGQRTQTWLAVSDDTDAKVSGGYWHNMHRQTPTREATETDFQHQLIDQLARLTGIATDVTPVSHPAITRVLV
jgi:NAD(P)-dependent dehydrogenase (short-subunit alcohol dehydrogenase family)